MGVVLDDGRRADVISKDDPNAPKHLTRADSMSFVTPGGDQVVQTIEREGRLQDDSEDDLPEINLKQRIMKSLPADASVSITTETTTTKTITVEITGTQPPDLSPPPGVELVEENAHHTGDVGLSREVLTNEQKVGLLIPRYRVVYRVVRNSLRGTNIESKGHLEIENAIEDSDDEAPVRSPIAIEVPPPLPPPSPPPP